MIRRTSSRDEVWMSAADLYLLLSFLFLGLVLVRMPVQGGEHGTIDLPQVRYGVGPLPREKTLTVEWTEGSIQPANLGAPCRLRVREIPDPIRSTLTDEVDVPCFPRAYLATPSAGSIDALEAAARSLEEPKRVAVVICHAGHDGEGGASPLLACARAQWLMIEAGFKTLALVRREEGR